MATSTRAAKRPLMAPLAKVTAVSHLAKERILNFGPPLAQSQKQQTVNHVTSVLPVTAVSQVQNAKSKNTENDSGVDFSKQKPKSTAVSNWQKEKAPDGAYAGAVY